MALGIWLNGDVGLRLEVVVLRCAGCSCGASYGVVTEAVFVGVILGGAPVGCEGEDGARSGGGLI
ncbi:biotin transporter BioY [Sesbania bispinosa]|nr:biotin transporter BioY [Sesbania bispinosa]